VPVWIAKNIGIVEPTLAHESFWIDGQPPAPAGIEHSAVMNIAMQGDNILRRIKKLACEGGSVPQ
jgi:hypothetical protein